MSQFDPAAESSRVRRGFTLIELLIIVVIIGILAAIAVPKCGATKGKARFAGMQSDLRNLTTAQESLAPAISAGVVACR